MEVNLKDILSVFPPLNFVGDTGAVINCVIQLDPGNADKNVLCWCNAKNAAQLSTVIAGTIIIPSGIEFNTYFKDCNYIIVENPRQYFNEVLTRFFWNQEVESSVSEQAVISESVKIGTKPFIGAQVIIKENCVIGNNVRILQNTIIYANTVVEDNVIIGANNVIGNYGFGYEKDKEGHHALMPHLGNVVIKSGVEIGNNNCIDRAVLGSTIIGRHTKIHNFVQVAHGVHIGENCLVTANVTISGSTIVGNNVWLGPGVTIANKIKIGNFSYLSMGAVIFSDVPEGATMVGNPGRMIKSNQK
ncbi:MAG TPA: UDP-3-O-(3-hydroxymyristoyl)glucosamine N-acyltransferase [Bacteroidia bacterium]|nr:UDP-3-O-(3-hydroxymyristoyl)glucosamine N-acyltransferase [Bacteroidia bacterium]